VDYYTKELYILTLFEGRHECGLLQLEMIYFSYICMAAFIEVTTPLVHLTITITTTPLEYPSCKITCQSSDSSQYKPFYLLILTIKHKVQSLTLINKTKQNEMDKLQVMRSDYELKIAKLQSNLDAQSQLTRFCWLTLFFFFLCHQISH
jgi:hypothetical protein